jgi:hypothetical protein
VSASRDHLVSALEAIRSSLDSGDVEAVAAQMDALVVQVSKAGEAGADPRVMALFNECQARAVAVLGALQRELLGHATSARAAAAYGGGR